jgi:hypothetical protein
MELPTEIIEHVITYLSLSDLRTLTEIDQINSIIKRYLDRLTRRALDIIPFPLTYTGEPLDWISHLNGNGPLSLANIKVEIVPVHRLWKDINIMVISKGTFSIECTDEEQYSRLGQQEYWLNGQIFHRINGPAKTVWLKSVPAGAPLKQADVEYQAWYFNGNLTYKIDKNCPLDMLRRLISPHAKSM